MQRTLVQRACLLAALASLTGVRISAADDARCAEPWVSITPTTQSRAKLRINDPARWTSSQRRWLELVRGFCLPAYESEAWSASRPVVGCLAVNGSLDDDTDEDQPAPPEAQTAEPSRVADVERFIESVEFGSFTAPGESEAIVELVRPAHWDRFYLMRKTSGRWEPIRFVESMGRTRFGYDCKSARMGSQRDLLVCMRGGTGGFSAEETIVVNDFRTDPPTQIVLAAFGHTTSPMDEVCAFQPGYPRFFLGGLRTFELLDVNGDGRPDIRAALTFREIDPQMVAQFSAAANFAQTCACAAVLQHDPYAQLKPGCPCPPLKFPPLRRATLEFVASAEQFVATEDTKHTLQQANALPDAP